MKHKLIYIGILLLLIRYSVIAQSVVVTDVVGFNTGDPSSMMDIKSATKGLLIPRVTLTASLSSASPVSAPATGLLVYNEGANQPVGFYYWNGSAWTTMAGASLADGSETKINSGSGVSVTGSGTTGTPYVINYATQSVTYVQRNNLTPTTSQMIICSDCAPSGELQVWNGSRWTRITGGDASAPGSPAIGSPYGGGIVAYIFQPGDPGYIAGQTHGLIAAASDISAGIDFGCNTTLLGNTGTALLAGYNNTLFHIAVCYGGGAAGACYYNYTSGLTNWYLPSKDELNKLYLNKTLIGGFSNASYWSSSEVSSTIAWSQDFSSGTQNGASAKTSSYRARQIRSF